MSTERTFNADEMEAAYNEGFQAGYDHAKDVISHALGKGPDDERRDADRPNFEAPAWTIYAEEAK